MEIAVEVYFSRMLRGYIVSDKLDTHYFFTFVLPLILSRFGFLILRASNFTETASEGKE